MTTARSLAVDPHDKGQNATSCGGPFVSSQTIDAIAWTQILGKQMASQKERANDQQFNCAISFAKSSTQSFKGSTTCTFWLRAFFCGASFGSSSLLLILMQHIRIARNWLLEPHSSTQTSFCGRTQTSNSKSSAVERCGHGAPTRSALAAFLVLLWCEGISYSSQRFAKLVPDHCTAAQEKAFTPDLFGVHLSPTLFLEMSEETGKTRAVVNSTG
eukprot:3311966-Amphidinium_carterae.1